MISTIIAIILSVIVIRHYKFIWITLYTSPRDAKLLWRLGKLALSVKLDGWRDVTIAQCFAKSVEKAPNKVCFISGEGSLTFQQVEELSNKLANYFQSKGYKKGDVIALLMDNRKDYPCVWLGLSKIGVVTALINYNLRLDSLAHCLKVSHAKALIYGQGFADAVNEVLNDVTVKELQLYSYDSPKILSTATDLQSQLKFAATTKPIVNSVIGNNDKLCYVYTSGTTGLPKAAVIKHNRLLVAARGLHHIAGCREDDVLLTPLPLYHSAGGLIAVSQALTYTTSIVILKKFSASRFWNDCITFKATAAVYLGELCRFLVSQPPKPEDKQHTVRLMIGGGLRAEIWDEFVNRFQVPNLVESYASTEGNCGMSNIVGHPGACGFFPRIFAPLLPMSLMKVDEFTGEPIRDPQTGLGVRCKPNEAGELIASINPKSPLRDFPGYTDKTSTSKKLVQNIFKHGDSCFRTGDIMMMDDCGYFYFRDRTGDTFRWKAENVSTMEVEAVMNRYCDMRDVAVYGVQIPGADGRAGMAAIADPKGDLNWQVLEDGVNKFLPSYARPIFIRILKTNVQLTGTFKLQKVALQKEGFDLTKIKDDLYIASNGKYIPLTKEIYAKLIAGQMRL